MIDINAYRDASPTVLFDVFSEAATRLKGSLLALADRAGSEAEKQEIWARIHALNEKRHSVGVEERDRLLELIVAWHGEREEVERRLQAGA